MSLLDILLSMSRNDWVRGPYPLLILIGVFIVLGAVSIYISSELENHWLRVIEIAVSGTLTAALVVLYFRQADILESQINREARQKHTETLRERVRAWHGNPDQEVVDDGWGDGQSNLPHVSGANFHSAPSGERTILGEEEEFRVLPGHLGSDRYLQDLLENHAPDLKKKRVEIQNLHDDFVSLREQFTQEFDAGITYENEEYTLKPEESLARWVFELIVMYERDLLDLEHYNDFVDYGITNLDRGNSGNHPDEPRLWIRAPVGDKESAVYSAAFDSDEKRDAHRNEVKEAAKEIVREILEQFEDDESISLVRTAGVKLDKAEKVINELEQILIEYDGRPIYTGDCQYLEEAQI